MRSISFGQAPSLRRVGGRRVARLAGALLAGVWFALGVGASGARPAGSDQVTISLLLQLSSQPGWDVVISNFEHVYPNITVDVTWGTTVQEIYQLEATELGAGNAPDLLTTTVGCGTQIPLCVLVRAGDLAPMLRAPWTKWSPRLLTSLDKYHQGLYAFTPAFSVFGIYTDNALFARLGLAVPQTFSQLLALCQKAHAAGTNALNFAGTSQTSVELVILALATATLYGHDKDWNSQLRAGKVNFDGTPAWHQALQEFIDMSNNACFEPGFTGTVAPVFMQGQALMNPVTSSLKPIAAPFSYSFYPFPGGTSPGQIRTFVNPVPSLSINAHASPQAQAAAQTFIDFVARPDQDALWAQAVGALTPFELLKGQAPPFMSPLAPVLEAHDWVLNPYVSWWNPDVLLALGTDAIGLVTGQQSIDDVLKAMDAAWKQGPS
jgi:raffinose/stachyose/melibiose transport system substrate-binding protein